MPCRLIGFTTTSSSHWLFYAAFVTVNTSLMLLQAVFPYTGPISPKDRALIVFNALFIAAGIFANLAFEEIGLGLYVVVLLARRGDLRSPQGPQPLVMYHSVAYVLGLVLTQGKNSHGLKLPVVWLHTLPDRVDQGGDFEKKTGGSPGCDGPRSNRGPGRQRQRRGPGSVGVRHPAG